jgi:acyl carrier protein
MTGQEQLWQSVTGHIRHVKRTLDASALNPDASLTGDLGLDSLDLVQLSASLSEDFPDVDLAPWLAQASLPGMDTLSSLITHLTETLARVRPSTDIP